MIQSHNNLISASLVETKGNGVENEKFANFAQHEDRIQKDNCVRKFF